MANTPMRIAIDIRRINEFGIGTYIWNLVRNLSQVDDRNEYLLVGSNRNFHELGPLGANFTPILPGAQDGSWRQHISLPLALRRRKPDVVHIPHHECPSMLPGELVVTIHDCVHVKFPPENLSRFGRYQLYQSTKRALKRASQILAVSNSTREDLLNIFDLDLRRISVIHNALDERFAPASGAQDTRIVLERYQMHDPFILYSGRIRPHKNVHRLIEAFAVLKNELADDPHYSTLKLIVIGDELSHHQYLRRTVVRSGVQQDVRFFGFVPYSILQVFYQSAALFAFPSLYEGFGLPPLEAMASRTPVLASNTSSLPEVLEDAALLVNPENVFEIARGMKSILLENGVRERLVARGLKHITRFSWVTAARQVIEAYERAAAHEPIHHHRSQPEF
jgi:glycosyltransferase involved in cell wall biosynthesis